MTSEEGRPPRPNSGEPDFGEEPERTGAERRAGASPAPTLTLVPNSGSPELGRGGLPSVPLLEINGATLVKNGTRILDNLSLTVPEGQHTAILGPNGSGKSSLIKLLTRQHYPLARIGEGPPVLRIFGRERWHVTELRSLLGIVSADLHRDFTADEALTGREAVLSGFFAAQGLAAHHEVTHTMYAHAEEALLAVDAANLADHPLARMSTGEARRILIARALAPRPRALLLDEPTAGLDLIARRRFLESLRPLAQSGVTLILVTHHVEEIIPEIERVTLMHQGAIFADGPKAAVLTSPVLSALFDAALSVQESGGYYSAGYDPSPAQAPPLPC